MRKGASHSYHHAPRSSMLSCNSLGKQCPQRFDTHTGTQSPMRLAQERKPCQLALAVTMTRHVLITASTNLMSTEAHLAAEQPNSQLTLSCRAAQLTNHIKLPSSPTHNQFTFTSLPSSSIHNQFTFTSPPGGSIHNQFTFTSPPGGAIHNQFTFTSPPGGSIHNQFTFTSPPGGSIYNQFTFTSIHFAAEQPHWGVAPLIGKGPWCHRCGVCLGFFAPPAVAKFSAFRF